MAPALGEVQARCLRAFIIGDVRERPECSPPERVLGRFFYDTPTLWSLVSLWTNAKIVGIPSIMNIFDCARK